MSCLYSTWTNLQLTYGISHRGNITWPGSDTIIRIAALRPWVYATFADRKYTVFRNDMHMLILKLNKLLLCSCVTDRRIYWLLIGWWGRVTLSKMDYETPYSLARQQREELRLNGFMYFIWWNIRITKETSNIIELYWTVFIDCHHVQFCIYFVWQGT
jgi:hypothetical protein